MAWLQLTLDSNQQNADQLSDLLQQFGAISVSLSAISDEPLFSESSTETETLWKHTRIKALLHEDTDLDVLLSLLRQRISSSDIHKYRIEHLAEKDWVGEYQQKHEARVFANKLCVCSGWQTPPDTVSHVLMLDPGLAFGTGSHETTSLCLEWLAGQKLQEKTIIDYGCGSGILALSALLLGASHAWAVDIDEQAITATQANAVKNHLQSNLTSGHPGALHLPHTDMLVANILLNPLISLAPCFSGLVKAGGLLALSGLLANQVDDCLAAYQSWFTMQEPVFNREWALLTGVRKQDPSQSSG